MLLLRLLLLLLPVPTVDVGFEVVFEAIILKFGKVGAAVLLADRSMMATVSQPSLLYPRFPFTEGNPIELWRDFFLLFFHTPRSGGRFSLICFYFRKIFFPFVTGEICVPASVTIAHCFASWRNTPSVGKTKRANTNTRTRTLNLNETPTRVCSSGTTELGKTKPLKNPRGISLFDPLFITLIFIQFPIY